MVRARSAIWTCVAALASLGGGGAHATETAAITSIRVEQGCTACAGSSLVLMRDGAATLTVTGNARMGGADQVSHGRIDGAAFARLASLIDAQGFDGLADAYETPGLRDGAWQRTTVVRGTREKQVFSRDDAGPEGLKRVDQALAEARQAIRFTP
jgi:hypothetical protein